MNELIQVGDKTYYVDGPFHIGVYKLDDENICLIDSGVDMVVAKVADKLFMEKGWRVKLIINTHYHADHSGGNFYFQEKYNCKIVSTQVNAALMSNYDICPAIIWGGSPIKEILNNYFYATPCRAVTLDKDRLPQGLTFFELPGHCISMICVRTDDDVCFVGDAVVAKETLTSHHISYIYEIGNYLESLDKLEKIEAGLFVPYHAEPVENIRSLVKANRKNVLENIQIIKDICKTPKSLDEIISEYFTKYDIKLSMYKYTVEGGIVRTYVSYLSNLGQLKAENQDNFIRWRTL